MFGNVNVDYKPCKSTVQLQRAADYILGRQAEQIQKGIIKTAENLYWGINCDRDKFAHDVLMTRILFGKRETKNSILAHKMSISFHPDDNDKITYDEAFRIAKEFAEKFMKGYEVLFAVHTDTEHTHVHFLIGNCHTETGKAYRRNQKDLYDMCEFFGSQCEQRGLIHSIRKDFYHHDEHTEKEKVGEHRMKAKGKETFKDELREVIQIELADPNNYTLENVVNALMKHYSVECRVKGNTISYRHPNFTNKNGKSASVRGSKLGEKYTVKGIKNELAKKSAEQTRGINYERTTETGSRTASESAEKFLYITGGNSAGNGAESSAYTGADSGNEPETGVSVSRECQGSAERRTSQPSDSGCSGDVPDFEGIFAEYQRRNGENLRKRNEESERSGTLHRKRSGIDR